MPDDWRKSRMVPIFKGKGDVLECNNYRGIKLMSHTMKLWEIIIETRLREITNIADNQFGFRPGKSTTEPIFALRMLQEKYREKNKELHMVFVDIEKRTIEYPESYGGANERKEFQNHTLKSFKICMKTVKPR